MIPLFPAMLASGHSRQLIAAAEAGDTSKVLAVLRQSPDLLNSRDTEGRTALLEAIVLSDGGPRHQRIVRLLLDHGARRDYAAGACPPPLIPGDRCDAGAMTAQVLSGNEQRTAFWSRFVSYMKGICFGPVIA